MEPRRARRQPAAGGRPAPVTAQAAAIRAAQTHPPTWKTIVKRAVLVAAAGLAIYLVLPSLTEVLASWPRLAGLNPAWFAVAAAEAGSFACNFGLQRLALRARGWFAVVTAGLAGNAVTDTLPGGAAAGAAAQFSMLATAGFDTDTAVGGLTAFSLLGVGGLLALPVLALPAMLAGAPVSAGLAHAAARRAGRLPALPPPLRPAGATPAGLTPPSAGSLAQPSGATRCLGLGFRYAFDRRHRGGVRGAGRRPGPVLRHLHRDRGARPRAGGPRC